MNFSSLEEVLKPTSYQIVGEEWYSKTLHQVGEKIQAYRATTTTTTFAAIAIATTTTTTTHSIIGYEAGYAMTQYELDYSK